MNLQLAPLTSTVSLHRQLETRLALPLAVTVIPPHRHITPTVKTGKKAREMTQQINILPHPPLGAHVE